MSHNHERSCFDQTSVHQLLERLDRRSSWSKKLGHLKKSNKFLQLSASFPKYVQEMKSVLPKMSSLPRPISYRVIFQQTIIFFNEQTRAVITRRAKVKFVRFWKFSIFDISWNGIFGLRRSNERYFDICFYVKNENSCIFQTIISLFHHVIPLLIFQFALEKAPRTKRPVPAMIDGYTSGR